MKNLSYWEREGWFSHLDVLIIGGGIVGLSTAIALKTASPSSRILIVESGSLPHGASTRNAGFACFGSVSEILADFDSQGEEKTLELISERVRGLKLLRQMLGDDPMGLANGGGSEIFKDPVSFARCADALPEINRKLSKIVGEDAFRIDNERIRQSGMKGVTNLIHTPYESQVDTAKMMQSFIRKAIHLGVLVLNGFEAESIEDGSEKALTHFKGDFDIKSRKVVVATNGFAGRLLELPDVRPARAQVMITEPVAHLRVKGNFHYDEGYYFFRDVGNRLLLGGGRNLDPKGEETTEMGTTPQIQDKLDNLLKETILAGVDFKVDMRWSGIMGMGPEKLPVIRNYSRNVVCAVRLGGMGVALGTLVGAEASRLVLGS